jgi:hypothetical protein
VHFSVHRKWHFDINSHTSLFAGEPYINSWELICWRITVISDKRMKTKDFALGIWSILTFNYSVIMLYQLHTMRFNISTQKKRSSPFAKNIPLTELLQSAGVWLSERWRPERLYSFVMERCRSRTMGQMAVGGKMCVLWSPSVHSGFTCDAHRLCNWNKMDDNSRRRRSIFTSCF